MWGPGCWLGQGMFLGMPFAMIMGIVFWLLVIYGLFVFISKMAKRGSGTVWKEETPMDILKKRYAKGEIDAEEFARKKKELEL